MTTVSSFYTDIDLAFNCMTETVLTVHLLRYDREFPNLFADYCS